MGNQNYEKFKMDEVKDKISILLGQTGAGKSTFINAITEKKNCKIGNGTESCTSKIQQSDKNVDGYNYYFVDTPGLDDGKGDDENIAQLGNIKQKYPRINVFIICLKLDDLKLTSSLKKSLIKFMEIFPCPKFWEHVIILRTHSERSKKFNSKKKKVEGKLSEAIRKDPDISTFMSKNQINFPSNINEYYVESDPDEEGIIDEETLNEFQAILNKIKDIHPIYKEVHEEIKEYINEEKKDKLTFIHIKTDKHIKFKDFDGKEHEVVQNIGDERYNLDGIRPILKEVKREQKTKPRGPLCWKNQYETNYYLIKYYELAGERKRVECFLEYRWENNDNEAEIKGEEYRKQLYDDNNKDSCCD